jgi:hypothetical protein
MSKRIKARSRLVHERHVRRMALSYQRTSLPDKSNCGPASGRLPGAS